MSAVVQGQVIGREVLIVVVKSHGLPVWLKS